MFTTMDIESQDRGLALLHFSAMQDAAKKGLWFDFEGSMIPGVAARNRQYNGDKEEYYCIYCYSDRYKLIKNSIDVVKNILEKKRG